MIVLNKPKRSNSDSTELDALRHLDVVPLDKPKQRFLTNILEDLDGRLDLLSYKDFSLLISTKPTRKLKDKLFYYSL